MKEIQEEQAQIIIEVAVARPVVQNGTMLESMKQKLDAMSCNAQGFTIFRVPAAHRDTKKALFEPSAISVGPFYRGHDSLRVMEEH